VAIGLYIVVTIPLDFHPIGLKFGSSALYHTPIFWTGLACWIFWITRSLRIGGYRYAFYGWWLCALWHGLLFLILVCSIVGLVVLGLDLIGSILSLVVLAVSWSVVARFMSDREGQRTAPQGPPLEKPD
jgi:hypothetical protein